MKIFRINIIALLIITLIGGISAAQAQSKREAARQTFNEALRSYVKGDIAKAKEGLRLAINQDSSYPHPRFNLGVIAAAEEDWAGAIQWLEEFLKFDNTSALAERAKSE